MVHKYFEITQTNRGTLHIAFSDDSLATGETVKLKNIELNTEEAKYMQAAIKDWLKMGEV